MTPATSWPIVIGTWCMYEEGISPSMKATSYNLATTVVRTQVCAPDPI
jgi:hypothetical protein